MTGKLLRYVLVIPTAIFTFIWVYPLTLVFMTAMKRTEEHAVKGLLARPDSVAPLFENIRAAIQLSGLGQGFVNSLLYAFSGALLSVLFAALAAYALTKLKIRGRFFWFMLIYSGTVFPFQMYLIPLYKMYLSTNLYDTRFGMMLFYTTIAIPFCLFVFRNFFTTLPNEIIEAAAIDGASSLRTFLSIIVPMSKAPAVILFLTQFMWIWNDLLFGQVLSKSEHVRPIMVSLSLLSGVYGRGSIPQVMAGALFASLPALILFFALQNYFMQGLTLTTAGE